MMVRIHQARKEQLGPVSSTHYCASTPGLSTWWSSTALRYLILREASRLDAFSGYPVHTYLPSCAPGGTTGAPEVCSTRSSPTRVTSSQISTPTADRDQTVARGSEPRSLTTLIV